MKEKKLKNIISGLMKDIKKEPEVPDKDTKKKPKPSEENLELKMDNLNDEEEEDTGSEKKDLLEETDELKDNEKDIIDIIDDELDLYMALFSQETLYDGATSSQISQVIDGYKGFLYVSNLKQNYEMASNSNTAATKEGMDSEFLHFEDMKKISRNMTINGLSGQWQYRDVSMEEKDRMNQWILNPANKMIYMMTTTLMGLGIDPLNAAIKREYQGEGPKPGAK